VYSYVLGKIARALEAATTYERPDARARVGLSSLGRPIDFIVS
jgi:hypothetical protein